uniref:Midnolin n=1 Tax=Macrostomum lignano TaxID=282301 RepID=A0A1I8F8V4_9PLAT
MDGRTAVVSWTDRDLGLPGSDGPAPLRSRTRTRPDRPRLSLTRENRARFNTKTGFDCGCPSCARSRAYAARIRCHLGYMQSDFSMVPTFVTKAEPPGTAAAGAAVPAPPPGAPWPATKPVRPCHLAAAAGDRTATDWLHSVLRSSRRSGSFSRNAAAKETQIVVTGLPAVHRPPSASGQLAGFRESDRKLWFVIGGGFGLAIVLLIVAIATVCLCRSGEAAGGTPEEAAPPAQTGGPGGQGGGEPDWSRGGSQSAAPGLATGSFRQEFARRAGGGAADIDRRRPAPAAAPATTDARPLPAGRRTAWSCGTFHRRAVALTALWTVRPELGGNTAAPPGRRPPSASEAGAASWASRCCSITPAPRRRTHRDTSGTSPAPGFLPRRGRRRRPTSQALLLLPSGLRQEALPRPPRVDGARLQLGKLSSPHSSLSSSIGSPSKRRPSTSAAAAVASAAAPTLMLASLGNGRSVNFVLSTEDMTKTLDGLMNDLRRCTPASTSVSGRTSQVQLAQLPHPVGQRVNGFICQLGAAVQAEPPEGRAEAAASDAAPRSVILPAAGQVEAEQPAGQSARQGRQQSFQPPEAAEPGRSAATLLVGEAGGSPTRREAGEAARQQAASGRVSLGQPVAAGEAQSGQRPAGGASRAANPESVRGESMTARSAIRPARPEKPIESMRRSGNAGEESGRSTPTSRRLSRRPRAGRNDAAAAAGGGGARSSGGRGRPSAGRTDAAEAGGLVGLQWAASRSASQPLDASSAGSGAGRAADCSGEVIRWPDGGDGAGGVCRGCCCGGGGDVGCFCLLLLLPARRS